MVLGDLLDELFRSLSGVGDSHDHFGMGGARASWLKSLKILEKPLILRIVGSNPHGTWTTVVAATGP